MSNGYFDKTIGGWLPNEEQTKNISGTITITYKFKDVEIPEEWDNIDIEQNIRENLSDYTETLENVEIELN